MARESTPQTIHLRAHAPVAERVLLPGDPGRALRLAQLLLDAPKMLNHNRGLWGYSGEASDGELLTIQSTGMGGPSAAIIVEELIDHGARRLVRVGTCGALVPASLGELVAAAEVLPADGTSRALGADRSLAPDEELHAALVSTGAREARVVSTDLFYDPRDEVADGWRRDGAEMVEMEAATLLAVAARRGVAAACVLVVSDLLAGAKRVRIDPDELLAAEASLGAAAAAALGV